MLAERGQIVERVEWDDEALARPRLELRAIYDRWLHEVLRWARALGAAESDLDDVAQEVFVVVQRKLGGFDGANVPAWLYRITARTVSDHRRRAWFRNLFRRRDDAPVDDLAATGPSPAEALEGREDRATVWRLVERMSPRRRAAFVLFEIEGYSGEEIARLEGIPVATVWTRLHHARRDFLAMVEQLRREEKQ
jgi:RNA polymerase sigma-70 factor (ECF subfamily)